MGNLVPIICEDCEKVFLGGPYAYLCPECRKKRLSEAAKRRGLNKMGTAAFAAKRKAAKEKEITEKET